MNGFERSLPLILRFEGGYVDNPQDPGGATNKGITQGTYDRFRQHIGKEKRPVREITDVEVRAIYRQRYWDAAKCDRLKWPVSLAHFDAAVNCGVRQAARFLQRAAGVADDGIIGPVSMAAVHNLATQDLLEEMLWQRVEYYRVISVRNRSDGRNLRVFLPGWLYRVIHLREAARKAA